MVDLLITRFIKETGQLWVGDVWTRYRLKVKIFVSFNR